MPRCFRFQDPDAAVAEMHRAVTELGFTAAFVRPNPCMGRSLQDPAYEPIWSAAEELDLAIGVHEGSSVIVPTLGSDRPFNPLVLHAISHSFEEMLAFAQLVSFGVLRAPPELCVSSFWSPAADGPLSGFSVSTSRRRHSEGSALRCACGRASTSHGSAGSATRSTRPTLPALLPFIGEERVVWGSDYPHHDATFPGAVAALRRTISPLGPEDRALVLGENASALYRLPTRYDGPAAVAQRYFAAVTCHDPEAIRSVFWPGAELVRDDTVVKGSDEIAHFYATGAFTYDDLAPDPGTLHVEGERVVVDLELHIDGTVIPVRDIFEMAGDRIAKLEIITLRFDQSAGQISRQG